MIENSAWRTASSLLQQFGDDAAIQAAMRAERLLERGNIDGQTMWLRVARAIEELLRRTPEADEPLN